MTQTSQKLNFSVKQANIKRQTRRKITYKLNISTRYVKDMRNTMNTIYKGKIKYELRQENAHCTCG